MERSLVVLIIFIISISSFLSVQGAAGLSGGIFFFFPPRFHFFDDKMKCFYLSCIFHSSHYIFHSFILLEVLFYSIGNSNGLQNGEIFALFPNGTNIKITTGDWPRISKDKTCTFFLLFMFDTIEHIIHFHLFLGLLFKKDMYVSGEVIFIG